MKNKKNFLLLSFFCAFILFFFQWQVAIAEEENSYYLLYDNDTSNNINIVLGKQEIIMEQAYGNIDLDNLTFFEFNASQYYSFNLDEFDMGSLTKSVRKYLLTFGYAKLDDRSLATEEEIQAEEYAVSEGYGGWAVNTNGDSGINTTEELTEGENHPIKKLFDICLKKISEFMIYLKKNYLSIVSIIVGCGILGWLYRTIIKTRKKTILLIGDNGSGKTTLKKLLLSPDASAEDLFDEKITLELDKKRIIRDDVNRRLILSATILDPPGKDGHTVIDELSKFHKIWWRKYIIVIMLAHTKSYLIDDPLDQSYLDEQFYMLNNLWIPLLKAKSMVHPETVVVFMNKTDILDEDPGDVFKQHLDLITQFNKENKKTNIKYIRGSIISKAGMTELMDIFKG